jgi:translation initiation factor 2 subunit 2
MAGGAAAANLTDLIEYDDMTTELFLAHLSSQTKRQRMAEKAAVADRKKAAAADAAGSSTAGDEAERKFDGSQGMSYNYMLERIMATCRQNNPTLARSERVQLMMPRVERSGAKKTALTNFKQLCHALNRTQEEVKDFIDKYLTSTSSVDSNTCLIIKIVNGKTSQFERMLEKYVEQYVKCNSCGQINTELHREASTRLQLLTCNGCKASRYTQAVGGATYQAQTTKRARMRAKVL